MDIDIRGLHVPVPTPLHDHARHRIERALRRFASRIRDVDVRLSDLNGPRGGVDKACQVTVTLVHGGHVHVHAVDEHLGNAIDLAAHRATRRLARQLDRRVDHRLH